LGDFYVKSVELDRLEPFINVLPFTVTTLKYDSIEAIRALLPQLAARVQQVQCPTTNTSEADKAILSCIGAFIRFVSVSIESFEFKQL